MGRQSKYDWEELLKEYLASGCTNKTEFARAKGINPSYFRRNTTDWPEKGAGGSKTKSREAPKKKKSNVTQRGGNTEKKKSVTNKSDDTKKVTQKDARKTNKKASEKDKSKIKDYLMVVTDDQPEELTEKELLFCFYFVNVHQFNATQSYLKAFDCNYQTANKEAHKLLVKPGIRAEVERLKKIKYQSIMVQAEDLVEKHMRIAFASITDFVDFGQVEIPIISGGQILMMPHSIINGDTGQEETKLFPVTKIVNDVRFKESAEVDGSLIKSIKVSRDGASIELHDPQKSMDWLERYFAWNPMDRHKVAFDKAKLKLEEKRLDLEREKIKGESVDETVQIVDNIPEGEA